MFRKANAVTRDVVIASIAATLLLAAAVIYLTAGSSERPTTDDSEPLTLRCSECGKDTPTTRGEIDRRTKAREFERTVESRATYFACAACGKMKAIVTATTP
ncbi:MAG: hypothetical protein ACKVS9_00510 [Phycisphaerae bacterium]